MNSFDREAMLESFDGYLKSQLGMSQRDVDAVTSGLSQEPNARVDSLLIYLDMKDWIDLARADTQHPQGADAAECLTQLRKGVSRGELIVPLSETHYIELAKNRNPRQRADVANVMSEISRFRTLAGQTARLRCEFDQALHTHHGRPVWPEKLQVIGTGVAFPFDEKDGPVGRIDWRRQQLPVEFVQHESFRALEFAFNQVVEYFILKGPTPKQQTLIPGFDWAGIHELIGIRAQREQELLELLNNEKNVAPLGDIIDARLLYWEISANLPKFLYRGGMSIETFFHKGKSWISELLDDIPCLKVKKILMMKNNKNRSRPWTTNDIYDLEGLAAAIPYCDVVITDKHASSALIAAGAEVKYQTKILRKISDLLPILDEHMSKSSPSNEQMNSNARGTASSMVHDRTNSADGSS